MLPAIRQFRHKNIALLFLALLLCVQSLSSLSHGLMMATQNHVMQNQVKMANDEMPPCHQEASQKNIQVNLSDCCSDGRCNSNECMIPASIYFEISQLNYFIPHRNEVFLANAYRAVSITAPPPIRPPIA